MGRRVAASAEIARCAHESRPEVMLPNAIHHHTCGERVVRAGNLAGQFQAAAAFSERLRLRSVENGKKTPGHLRTEAAWIAAHENVRRAHDWRVFDRHGPRPGSRI